MVASNIGLCDAPKGALPSLVRGVHAFFATYLVGNVWKTAKDWLKYVVFIALGAPVYRPQ